jgi:hypothetical protein
VVASPPAFGIPTTQPSSPTDAFAVGAWPFNWQAHIVTIVETLSKQENRCSSREATRILIS